MADLTQKRVRELFDYHAGMLFRKIRIKKHQVGDRVGYVDNSNGKKYRRMKIDGTGYKEASIVFLWHFGYLPKQVDHKNRNSLDNNVDNLREATNSQNGINAKKKRGSSKFKGVRFMRYVGKRKTTEKWRSRICFQRERIHLGYFNTEKEAALAYNTAASELFGEFANLNIVEAT